MSDRIEQIRAREKATWPAIWRAADSEDIQCLLAEIDRLKAELVADEHRWAWLQAKFGEMPWRLTGWVPGTHNVRIAIDHAIKKESGDDPA